MKDNVQLIKYEKENFFEKIKNKIINMFSKKKNIKKVSQNTKNNIPNIDKKSFIDTYEKAKKQEIDIENLDKETIRKILLMEIEELNISSEKIDRKLESFEINLNNVKMYNREIKLLKKNKSIS